MSKCNIRVRPWRNWQTRSTKDAVGQPVGVRFPLVAPNFQASAARVENLSVSAVRNAQTDGKHHRSFQASAARVENLSVSAVRNAQTDGKHHRSFQASAARVENLSVSAVRNAQTDGKHHRSFQASAARVENLSIHPRITANTTNTFSACPVFHKFANIY